MTISEALNIRLCELADNLRTTQVAIEQRDMKIGELEKRVKALEGGKSDLEHDYCTCGETETWFDHSVPTDSKGNVLQDMCERCVKCGKEKGTKAPAPDLLEASTVLMEYLQSPQCAVENFDIPDDIYGPFVDAVKKGGCAPAPDLEAQITKTIEDIKYLFLLPPDIDIPATEGHLRQLLRAFAAELGVE